VQQIRHLELKEKLREKQQAENLAQQEFADKQRLKSKSLMYGSILKNELLSKQKIKKQTSEIKTLNQAYDMQAIREAGEQEIKR
jgi:hypothetical protein